jgi:hypothetical protein
MSRDPTKLKVFHLAASEYCGARTRSGSSADMTIQSEACKSS